MKLQTLGGDGVGTFFFLPSPARHRRTHVRDLAADRTDSTSTPRRRRPKRARGLPRSRLSGAAPVLIPRGPVWRSRRPPAPTSPGPVSGIASSSASGARERCAARRGATSSPDASHAFENAPSTPSGTRATTHARGPTSGVGGHGASPPPNGRGSDVPICDAAVLETPSPLPVREQTSSPCRLKELQPKKPALTRSPCGGGRRRPARGTRRGPSPRGRRR